MLNGIEAGDPVYGAPTGPAAGQALGQDAFMKLLVSQMQNQDPIAPQDNQAFIAQLAQFSTLEQTTELNDNIVGLAVLQQGNALLAQLTSSSALIGKQIVYLDPQTQEQRTGAVDSVKIEDGTAVLNVDGQDVPLGSVVEVTGPADGAGDDAGEGDSEDK